jgi:hypothetical protein
MTHARSETTDMTTLRKFWWASLAPSLVLTGLIAGCNTDEPANTGPPPLVPAKKISENETPKKAEPAPPPIKPKEDTKDTAPPLKNPNTDESPKSASNGVQLSEKEIATIQTLPAADQAIALKQKVCPVSGGHLGEEGMGAPVKITAEGRTFFLCCKGCEDDVKADPKAVIAKLGK